MSETFIIAEVGVNHNGDISVAKKLIDLAVDAGADAVKFQMFNADRMVTVAARKAKYQEINTGLSESQYDMLKKLELGEKEQIILKKYCQKRKTMYLASPFDVDSAIVLNNIGLDVFKIPSGEITNLPLLRQIAFFAKKIILSTGMSTMLEIEQAMDVFVKKGLKKEGIILLHCNTEYPTPIEHVNLLAMVNMRKKFQVDVGYSDHTIGIDIPIAAVALGAKVIEKHFTLDKNMKGPDHKASLDIAELEEMIRRIRNIEKALGNGEKKPSLSEKNNLTIVRKSLVAKKKIKQGEIFSERNITAKRPGNGISPMRWDSVLGCRASRDFEKDEEIIL